MTHAHINRIATGVPSYDMHANFVKFAGALLADTKQRALFDRMAAKSQIGHRYSVLAPARGTEDASLDDSHFYERGCFPSTGERMRLFEEHAPVLAASTVAKLALDADAEPVTHLIVTSCTGMYAPGLDFDIIERCGLPPSVERTMIGFMGCYAAINALKLARHIVRSSPRARVLVVDVELCSLHFQERVEIEKLLSFLVFSDGCAASLVSAQPVGVELDSFHAVCVPDTRRLITWNVGDAGFDMVLSGRVPAAISRGLASVATAVLGGASVESIDLWAVHPGGRSVLDAVQQGLALAPDALAASRGVLDRFGNMSSATVMFVLAEMLALAVPGRRGCAMSFGPGLTAETMLFHTV